MLLDSFDGASRRLVTPADACGARGSVTCNSTASA